MATAVKSRIVCIECGAKFTRIIKASTVEIECPKCGSTDVEVA